MHSHVHVFSDSNYAIRCVTEWFQVWEKRGWLTSARKAVENRDLVEDVLVLIRDREKCGSTSKFAWVKAHSVDEGNIAADALAVNGATLPPVD
jgi:ribonuclease HI